VWILKNGSPSVVAVVVGVSDGQRTEIVEGDLKPSQEVIVDSTTARE
jgi:HlyD family secretion protein